MSRGLKTTNQPKFYLRTQKAGNQVLIIFLLTLAYVRPPCNKIQKGKEIKIIKFLNTYLMISKIFQNPDENKCSNQEEFINKSKCVSYGCDHNNLKK